MDSDQPRRRLSEGRFCENDLGRTELSGVVVAVVVVVVAVVDVVVVVVAVVDVVVVADVTVAAVTAAVAELSCNLRFVVLEV